MKLRVGYELIYDCPQATPMILMLHPSKSFSLERRKAKTSGLDVLHFHKGVSSEATPLAPDAIARIVMRPITSTRAVIADWLARYS